MNASKTVTVRFGWMPRLRARRDEVYVWIPRAIVEALFASGERE